MLPTLGRRLVGDPDYDVELIYGARRLFIARHLNKPLLVDVRQISDREGIVAMDIENRQRTDVSPYERGVGFAKWLRAGHFKTQDDIARALKISAAQVSRLLKLAHLPSVVLDAFEGPAHLCEGWGLDIMDALNDPARRTGTLKAARDICAASVRPNPNEVYRVLLSASARGHKVKRRERDEVVKGDAGELVFRIRQQAQTIALLLPRSKVSASTLGKIRTIVLEVLQAENAQAIDDQKRKVANGRAALSIVRPLALEEMDTAFHRLEPRSPRPTA